MNNINILIGCEESDEVRSRFEKLGFNAWSCDIQPNRNKYAKHYQCNIMEILQNNWHCLIAFPPCTHLASSGAAWFERKKASGEQAEAIKFFLQLANANIEHICIENPVGIMSKNYRKPNQIIQPYYFGDKAQKTTCLWLKNLPKLYHNKQVNLFDNKITHVEKGEFFVWYDKKLKKYKRQPMWFKNARNLPKLERSKVRSKTFPGIANAMAEQWGAFLINKYKN